MDAYLGHEDLDESSSSDESEDELFIDDMGKVKSKSLIKQYRTCKNHFINFLIHKKSKYQIDNMPNDYLTTRLIGEFATFMIKDLKMYSIQTLLAYISDIKN